MAKPPDVIFGPSGRADRWWALLPSSAALRAGNVSDLLDVVERAMEQDAPGRPYAFRLDLYGSGEPGADSHPPQRGSAAHCLAERRLPRPAETPYP